ncbi:hypothetical protein [Singulisphaera acidiphila]|uniref:Uncharacterized protein n=1 Tax=Singulisphaera acidiphila (strain ATCC BAA-1392 / DSM 18658 / VKM B-2454 / MOB10) TaxID=886293 RepID=L0DPU5_SINAD|nr:hypothetical protein [Singulisphaera acidiphila]AGA31277.1 hypothetical protein Sinac_7229 [Singulisphaera acidiphila DSM 18658]
MRGSFRRAVWGLAICLLVLPFRGAGGATIRVASPMTPPEWALLERELFRANTAACEEFFARYFDDRGYLECVERWGGDDGPDDAIENCNDWPHLHALGAPEKVLQMYKKAWEGHLRQFTEARTKQVPLAVDGMYYKEFPVMFDWQHNAEGLSVFNLQGLSDPGDVKFGHRVRRYAGFYMNEDPGAPNYDSEHQIIRSLFNGSRGPLLRRATPRDWAGDPIEVESRFKLGHGERSYDEMLAHFQEYTDIVGDHPLNLLATTLALNAYMLTHEEKYRLWLLEYVDAWAGRMEANGGVIPSNIGLDGKIGGASDGKWYGGTYGWAFTVRVPQTGLMDHRNRVHWSFIGFMNAYLLTGNDRYLDLWRKQADVINAQGKMLEGKLSTPRMYGVDGWYAFEPGPYQLNALEIYYLSMKPGDRAATAGDPWLKYLDGEDSGYPVRVLRGDLSRIRQRVEGMRRDSTSPDTRLADDPMEYNPASVTALIQLMQGGLHITRRASVLHCRLRYFDPIARRAGVPEDVAALVEAMTGDSVTLSLVNTSQVAERTLVVQAGAYAEHEFHSVSGPGDTETPIKDSTFTVQLAPGSGTQLKIAMKRFKNRPTLIAPWDRP